MTRRAPILLCIDLQREFIADGRPFADPNGEDVAMRCGDLIALARSAGWTIMHTVPGSDRHYPHGLGLGAPIERCEPDPQELFHARADVSALASPVIDAINRSEGNAEVFAVGFSAPTSLTATMFDAERRGLPLNLVDGAFGAADVGEWAAQECRDVLAATAQRIGRLEGFAALLERLDTEPVAVGRI